MKGLGPKSGRGTEIYLVPGVTVPPTTLPDQSGIEPGSPIPDDGNTSFDTVAATQGTITEGSGSVLPIEVRIEKNVSYRLENDSAASAEAFSVTKNSLLHGLEVNFLRKGRGDPTANVSDSNLVPPSGFDIFSKNVSLIEGDDGALYAFCIAGTDPTANFLVALRYHQADGLNSGFTQAGISAELVSDMSFAGVTKMFLPELFAFKFRGQIYVFVTAGHATGAASSGTTGASIYATYIYLPGATPNQFVRVSDPGFDSNAVIDAGVAATATRDTAVIAYGVRQTFGSQTLRTVKFGFSSDLRCWSDSVLNCEPIGLSDFRRVANDKFVDIRMHTDGLTGWAVGRGIYKTVNGGLTWNKQNNPSAVTDFYSVFVFSESIAYVGGREGVVLKTTDGGATWLIANSANSTDLGNSSLWVGGVAKNSPAIGGSKIIRILGYDMGGGSQYLWVIGQEGNLREFTKKKAVAVPPLRGGVQVVNERASHSGYLAVSNTGGQEWKDAIPKTFRDDDGALVTGFSPTDAVLLRNAEILVSGSFTVRGKGTFGLLKIRMKNPNDNNDYHKQWQHYFGPPVSLKTLPDIFSLYRVSENVVYMADFSFTVANANQGNTKHILKWSRTDPLDRNDLGAFTAQEDPYSGEFAATSLFVSTDQTELCILYQNGYIYRSLDAGASWLSLSGNQDIGSSMVRLGADTILVAGQAGIELSDVPPSQRCYPSLLTVSDNLILMAVCNPDKGKIEIFDSSDGGRRFFFLTEVNLPEFQFPAATGTIPLMGGQHGVPFAGNVLKPCLFLIEQNYVALVAGTKEAVSFDNGKTWTSGTDQRLPAKVGGIRIDSQDVADGYHPVVNDDDPSDMLANPLPCNHTRQAVAYGGGRLFSVFANESKQFRAFTAREWRVGKTDFMPIFPGTPSYVGVDDLRIAWIGNPNIGDSWMIPARYRFAAGNVVVESPSVFYRSGSVSTQVMEWDRNHPDVVAVLGPGFLWNISALAIFGVNFRYCRVAISKPSYTGSTFPSSPADYIEYELNSDVDQFFIGQILGSIGEGRVLVTNKQWTPGIFKPITRRYYAAIYFDLAGLPHTVLPILDNSVNSIQLGSGTEGLILPNQPVRIFTDRMFRECSGGSDGASTFPSVYGTAYQYGRHVRLTIPTQPTSDGFFRIGTIVFGPHVPVNVDGIGRRNRFSRGFRWQLVPLTEESVGQSGVSSVIHFGRPPQRWELSYEHIAHWDRDATLSALGSDLRRSFCFVFDDREPLSCELVRMSNGPEIINQSGNRFSYGVSLSEVL